MSRQGMSSHPTLVATDTGDCRAREPTHDTIETDGRGYTVRLTEPAEDTPTRVALPE